MLDDKRVLVFTMTAGPAAPSFLIWSFDSADVDQAQRSAERMRDAISEVIGEIKPVYERLHAEVERQIGERWNEIENKGSGDGGQDAIARHNRTRRREDEDGLG